MKKYWCGIDVGKDGGIVIQNSDNNTIDKYEIPLIGTEFDIKAMRDIFCKYVNDDGEINMMVVMEKLSSIYGASAKANFSFGGINLATEAIIVCLGIPMVRIMPKKWQKELWEGIPIQTKNDGKTATKVMSLIAMQKLFPNFDARTTSRQRVQQDGIVDAILLSEYCKRFYK